MSSDTAGRPKRQGRGPVGAPPSAGVLARYARAFAQELEIAEGRVRVWVANMILAGLFEDVAIAPSGRRFTVKGGVALELRLRDRARATKDIDLVVHGLGAYIPASEAANMRQVQAALTRSLEEAVTAGTYQGFAFRRKGEPILLENGTVSLELGVTYRGDAWTSITVDLARAEAGEGEVELLPAIPLTEALGVNGPAELPCLPLRFHIAQKLHAMTLPPRKGKRNERFKDLVDLLLMEELLAAGTSPDFAGIREACEIVFSSRGTHSWPPVLVLPSHWEAPFARMAQELGLPIVDATAAMDRVRALVTRISTTA